MDRHDLAYLRDSATLHFFYNSLAEAVIEKVDALLSQNIPMTVCRQENLDSGQVKLAINCLVNGCKYRVACRVDAEDIELITRPVSLHTLLIERRRTLSDVAISDFAEALQMLGCEVYVYGSYAYEYLTKEAYVRSSSDLDLLLYPQKLTDIPEILQRIEHVQKESQIRLDGEIQIHPDWHVSFNELISVYAEQHQQIIVKGLHRVDMLKLEHLLEGSCEYANTTTA